MGAGATRHRVPRLARALGGDAGAGLQDQAQAPGHARHLRRPSGSVLGLGGLGGGVVAAVLLVSGGLGALQAASIVAALPFSVVMPFMCWGLIRGRAEESAIIARARGPPPECLRKRPVIRSRPVCVRIDPRKAKYVGFPPDRRANHRIFALDGVRGDDAR
ncbi:BCCT family transporter [Salinarimonas sp. NSM]|uniref:BCCT family transporter n=1 Tax=Salinarimonas sp. NSM TaxID=3458003 RepID=UPI004035154E